MISDLQVATADDGKRIVLYPLEITLRDYFAAAALAGRLANPGWCEQERDDAEFAYSVADEMLAERAK